MWINTVTKIILSGRNIHFLTENSINERQCIYNLNNIIIIIKRLNNLF